MGSKEFHEFTGIPWILRNSKKFYGIPRIQWNSTNSTEFHEFNGIPWIRWSSMNSMEFHEFDGIPRIQWNSTNSMEFHEFNGIPGIQSEFHEFDGKSMKIYENPSKIYRLEASSCLGGNREAKISDSASTSNIHCFGRFQAMWIGASS